VTVLATTDEEIGSPAARTLIQAEALRCAAALLGGGAPMSFVKPGAAFR
jgi:acetylornithine deacetylase/succinyl-diaminopimelate desuccinylase-like protein